MDQLERKRVSELLRIARESIIDLEESIHKSIVALSSKNRPEIGDRLDQYKGLCATQDSLLSSLEKEFLSGMDLDWERIRSDLARFYALSEMIRVDARSLLEALVNRSSLDATKEDTSIN